VTALVSFNSAYEGDFPPHIDLVWKAEPPMLMATQEKTITWFTDVMAKRFLVIDDECSIREVLKYCLEELAGWTVITAQSGLEGLAIAKDQAIDGILLDVMMPEMDGYTFLQYIKSDPVTRHIPVVLITAKVDVTRGVSRTDLGIAGIIPKPFDPLTLPDQISQSLGWA
jgi:CheY-like chemotaxis protein